jgi:chemotaxis protein histidine kinase CheA
MTNKKKKTIIHKFKNVMDKIITLIKKKTKKKQIQDKQIQIIKKKHKHKQPTKKKKHKQPTKNKKIQKHKKKPTKKKKQPTKNKNMQKHKKQATKKKKQVIKKKKQPTKKKHTEKKHKKQPTIHKSFVKTKQHVRRKSATTLKRSILKYDTLKDSMLKNSMLKKSALKDYISNNSKNYSFNEKEALAQALAQAEAEPEANKSTKPISTISNYAPKSSKRFKSYIPSINNKLQIRSLRTLPQLSINLCDSLLELNISTTNNDVCLPYNSNKVKDILLHNLKASKHLDVTKFIPPVQFLSNCWFNTMFVTFFFSDKGRVFFRFFRELMITGRKVDSTLIPEEFAKIFFILNLFIEASYNQSSKSNILFNKINYLTDKLNTNYFVYHIYKIINNPAKSISPTLLITNSNKIYNIPDVEDPGNPLTYYETILKYLKYNTLKLFKHSITRTININDVIQKKYVTSSINVIPDIVIIEDFQSGTLFDNTIKLTDAQNNTYNYVLDAIIITNKDHFDPKANSHFVSVLTVNKEEYKFDGSSLSKLSRFEWKKMINQDKDWTFKEDPEYEPERYNFTKGYKIMFYYRS